MSLKTLVASQDIDFTIISKRFVARDGKYVTRAVTNAVKVCTKKLRNQASYPKRLICESANRVRHSTEKRPSALLQPLLPRCMQKFLTLGPLRVAKDTELATKATRTRATRSNCAASRPCLLNLYIHWHRICLLAELSATVLTSLP